jgi:PAS domain S-box-containing protein
VLSSSPAVLFVLRVEGQWFQVDWVSNNVERLLGYPAAEVTAEWWESRLHPHDRERVMREVMTLFTSSSMDQEYRFRNQQGDYVWLRAELRLLRDAAGNPIEAVGSWAVVTARKEAELRLLESEEQYRLLFEGNPHPMWVFDSDSLRFLAVNDAAISHYGYSSEEFLRMSVTDMPIAEDLPVLRRSILDDPVTGHATLSLRHVKRDRSEIQVEIERSRIRFHGREARLALVVDVTDKRNLESQLRHSQKMESVGRLAGGVAHDFNNLLGVITGYGDLLAKRLPPDDRMGQYIDNILKAAVRGAGLTRQLLAFSRRQVLQPRLLDLNAVVEDVNKMLLRLIGEDIRLTTSLDPDLPAILADAGQLEQVLMNLAVNARDAMPRGGRILVETRAVQFDAKYAHLHPGVEPGSYVMLAVSDTGSGMTPEIRDQIFEPFFTTKEDGKGTGLGLATVHGIVKQSGGHIYVYSEPGRGSTFKVHLPAAIGETDAPPAEELPAPRGAETILVVEDEAALRQIVREVLEESGYTVLDAAHGMAAHELCTRTPGTIDLLITDVVMPGIGGSELAALLRGERPDMRVLYISGYTDDAVVVHEVMTGNMPFLAKPFTPADLARKVREVLDRKSVTGSHPHKRPSASTNNANSKGKRRQ